MTKIKNHIITKINIEVIYAGGTISSLMTPKGYREGGHVIDLLKILDEKIHSLKDKFEIHKPVVAYTGLSENITKRDLKKIEQCVFTALKKNPDGILITHGTDSMEQTAKYLNRKFHSVLISKGVCVFLTGANEDISHPHTDAWDNLSFALHSFYEKKISRGVFVAFHKKLIPADLVVKEPYNGFGMNFISINDPEYVKKIQVLRGRDESRITKLKMKISGSPFLSDASILEYHVHIVRENHNTLLTYVETHPVKIILLVLYHSGTANTTDDFASVSTLVRRLRKTKNILFFGVTETGEPVDLHSYETSVTLRNAGVVPLYTMSGNVAMAKLKTIRTSASPREYIQYMLTDKVGELHEEKIIKDDVEKLLNLYNTH